MDANHAAIVEALRRTGCSVLSLASIGKGAPDLLVGIHGRNVLLEVKAEKGLLRANQAAWRSNWLGPVWTVRTPAEAIAALKEEFDDD